MCCVSLRPSCQTVFRTFYVSGFILLRRSTFAYDNLSEQDLTKSADVKHLDLVIMKTELKPDFINYLKQCLLYKKKCLIKNSEHIAIAWILDNKKKVNSQKIFLM